MVDLTQRIANTRQKRDTLVYVYVKSYFVICSVNVFLSSLLTYILVCKD